MLNEQLNHSLGVLADACLYDDSPTPVALLLTEAIRRSASLVKIQAQMYRVASGCFRGIEIVIVGVQT